MHCMPDLFLDYIECHCGRKGLGNKPIVYFIYSDASQIITVGKGFTFHRIIVFIGSRRKYGYRTIGWLPIVRKADLPVPISQQRCSPCLYMPTCICATLPTHCGCLYLVTKNLHCCSSLISTLQSLATTNIRGEFPMPEGYQKSLASEMTSVSEVLQK